MPGFTLGGDAVKYSARAHGAELIIGDWKLFDKDWGILKEKAKEFEAIIEHPFWEFYKAMIREYERHEPEKGDSWKQIDVEDLWKLLADIGEKHQRNVENKGELVDLANVEAMLWLRRV